MENLLETFQKIVDVGREDSYGEANVAAGSPLPDGGSTGVNSAGGDADEVRRLLLAKHAAYDDLVAESTELQKRLAKSKRHLSSQRELWLSTVASQQITIEKLVGLARRRSSGAVGGDGQGGSEVRPVPPVEEDSVYVHSLLEQIDLLKTSLAKVTNEREKAKLELECLVRERIPQRGSTAAEDDQRAAVEKLNAFWHEEREAYEQQMEELTRAAAKSAESLKLLAQRHSADVDGLANAKRTFMESVAALRTEDTTRPVTTDLADSDRATNTWVELSADGERTEAPHSGSPTRSPHPTEGVLLPAAPAAPSASAKADSPPTPAGGTALAKALSDAAAAQRALEQSQQECHAREEALTAMYEDNRLLGAENDRLRRELELCREEADRACAEVELARQRLRDVEQHARAQQHALAAAQAAQQRGQQEVLRLQETIRAHAAQGPTQTAAAVGSVIVSSAGSGGGSRAAPTPPARAEEGPVSSPARDFVTSATAKLVAAPRRGSFWVHHHLKLILVVTIGFTVITFLSLAFGPNNIASQGMEGPLEALLSRKLRECEQLLNVHGIPQARIYGRREGLRER